MTKTTNYQLNQWDPTDRVLRTDFNSDNQKIDAALGEMPKIIAGSYTGDGAASRVISLGFTPKAVFVWSTSGIMTDSNGLSQTFSGGLALPDAPCIAGFGNYTYLALAEDGFQVYYAYIENIKYYISTNTSGSKYWYLAIG